MPFTEVCAYIYASSGVLNPNPSARDCRPKSMQFYNWTYRHYLLVYGRNDQ